MDARKNTKKNTVGKEKDSENSYSDHDDSVNKDLDNEKNHNVEDSDNEELQNKEKVLKFKDDSENERESSSKNSQRSEIQIEKYKWSLEVFHSREKRIKEIFLEIAGDRGKVKLSELPSLFIKVIDTIRLLVYPYQKIIFNQMVDSLQSSFNKKSPKSKKPRPQILDYKEFTNLLKAWGEKYNEDQEKISGKISQTILNFQNLKSTTKAIPNLTKIIETLTSSLETCLKSYLINSKEKKHLKKSIKKNIIEIFLFYGKSQKIQGTLDTFEGIENCNNTWNLGKFLKFCSDFDLILKSKVERKVSKDQLVSIFKKTASNTRLMSQSQFIESLDKIADFVYSASMDKVFNTDFGYLSLGEKREVLYKALGIHKFNDYHSKVKSFGNTEVIINTQPKPNKQDYKLSESLKQHLERLTSTKRKNSTSPINTPAPSLIKKKFIITRKSTNNLNPNETGYARRAKKTHKKDENSSIPAQDPKSNFSNLITINALTSLDFNGFDEYDLKELISEEKDEYFDQLYKIEPKLQGIMKMHEDKLTKGQKVLEKTRQASLSEKKHPNM